MSKQKVKDWFTSDTHFRHDNRHGGIVKMCNRPFVDVADMDEGMIERWNARVGQNDTVYHLGDFGFGRWEELAKIRQRLNGRIVLIRGNHDHKYKKQIYKIGFDEIHDLLEIKIDGQSIFLCHYAMRTWNKSHYGAIMLYGHSHGYIPPTDRSLDVGVDAWDYAPISFDEIRERLSQSPKHFEDRYGIDQICDIWLS